MPSNSRVDSFIRALGARSALALGVAFSFASLVLTPDLRRFALTSPMHADAGWPLVLFPFALLCWVLLPAVLTGAWLSSQDLPRAARLTGFLLTTTALFVVQFDSHLYRSFGRHVRDLWAYARTPEAAQAVGRIEPWLVRGAFWLACAALGALSSELAVSLYLRWSRLMSPVFARALSGLAVLVLCIQGAMPRLLLASAPQEVSSRLATSLWFDLSAPSGTVGAHRGPLLGELEAALGREYAARFSFVFGPPPAAKDWIGSEPAPPVLPNFDIVVTESLRADAFSSETMPRLWAWSATGLRFDGHYSGANHSETGMFSLLYGRSVLTYHSTLDARAPPVLCAALREIGYRCGYFTGHPRVWLRREEFLNEHTMDVYGRDDHGDWNEWDERALARASGFLAEGPGRVAITFLMSSHYEYRYPQAYRRHLPDSPPRVPWASEEAERAEFLSSRNRYANVVGYVDDIVADHIGGLDASSTYVVFTGDHGEETGENGRFGHGYGFGDPLVRVPFVLTGPGISPEIRRNRSVHQDLVPTVLELLGRAPRPSVGSSLLHALPAPRPLLLVHAKPDFRTAKGLFLVGDLRLALDFDLTTARLRVVGFEDSLGRAVKAPDVDVAAIGRMFSEQLDRAGSHPH